MLEIQYRIITSANVILGVALLVLLALLCGLLIYLMVRNNIIQMPCLSKTKSLDAYMRRISLAGFNFGGRPSITSFKTEFGSRVPVVDGSFACEVSPSGKLQSENTCTPAESTTSLAESHAEEESKNVAQPDNAV